MSPNGYSANGHKNGWPPLPVHPGDGSEDDSAKLIAMIAAAQQCGPDCMCPCRDCSIDEPYVMHGCWHGKLVA